MKTELHTQFCDHDLDDLTDVVGEFIESFMVEDVDMDARGKIGDALLAVLADLGISVQDTTDGSDGLEIDNQGCWTGSVLKR